MDFIRSLLGQKKTPFTVGPSVSVSAPVNAKGTFQQGNPAYAEAEAAKAKAEEISINIVKHLKAHNPSALNSNFQRFRNLMKTKYIGTDYLNTRFSRASSDVSTLSDDDYNDLQMLINRNVKGQLGGTRKGRKGRKTRKGRKGTRRHFL
jgi:hypothetical protein